MTKPAQPLKSATFTNKYGIRRRDRPRLIQKGIIKDIQQGGYLGDNLHHEKIVVFDRDKLNQHLERPIEAGEIIEPMQIVHPLPLICQKCGKLTIVVNKVKRKWKNGFYTYIEWRHWDNRKRNEKGKKGGYVHHYQRVVDSYFRENVGESH